MVDISLGWKVLKIRFLPLAFLITFKKFDTIRGFLKDKGKSSYHFVFQTIAYCSIHYMRKQISRCLVLDF